MAIRIKMPTLGKQKEDDEKYRPNVKDELAASAYVDAGKTNNKGKTPQTPDTGNASGGNNEPKKEPPVYNPPISYAEPTELSATLNNVLASKPADFDYDQYNRILGMMENYQNREPFSYDLNADMLYQQYKNQYMQNGQRAMQDTVGQIAAVNGGYANSYAQTAGQQAYNNELGKLNNVIPELYQLAYNRYANEGDEMLKGIDLANDAYKTRYNEYENALGNWRNDVNLANNLYQDERNFDYNVFNDNLNRQQKQQALDLDNYQTALSMAQQNAGSSSLNATMNELVRMGIITEDTARNLSNTYSTYTPAKASFTGDYGTVQKVTEDARNYTSSVDALADFLKNAVDNGRISEGDSDIIFRDLYDEAVANEKRAEKKKEIEDTVSKYGYYFREK